MPWFTFDPTLVTIPRMITSPVVKPNNPKVVLIGTPILLAGVINPCRKWSQVVWRIAISKSQGDCWTCCCKG
jgi:hypothetical protein